MMMMMMMMIIIIIIIIIIIVVVVVVVVCIYQNYTVPTTERYNSEEIAMWVHNSLLYTVGKYPVFTTNFFFN